MIPTTRSRYNKEFKSKVILELLAWSQLFEIPERKTGCNLLKFYIEKLKH